MSQCMIFPTMWYVRPAKAQTSLCISAVWSEPLQIAWVLYECSATDWTSFGDSKLQRKLHRLVWVYTCQNATLLEISCHGSYMNTLRLYIGADGLLNVKTQKTGQWQVCFAQETVRQHRLIIWAVTCDFQQCDILTFVDLDEPCSLLLSLETPNGVQSVA